MILLKTVSSLKELEIELKKQISQAMQTEVASLARQVMKDKIEDEVYSVYSPKEYVRTGELISDDNIKTEMINDSTLLIQNIRSDGDRYVAEVVETGQGYEYEWDGMRPRPFTHETAEHFKDTNEHIAALYRGLKKQGLNVQVK